MDKRQYINGYMQKIAGVMDALGAMPIEQKMALGGGVIGAGAGGIAGAHMSADNKSQLMRILATLGGGAAGGAAGAGLGGVAGLAMKAYDNGQPGPKKADKSGSNAPFNPAAAAQDVTEAENVEVAPGNNTERNQLAIMQALEQAGPLNPTQTRLLKSHFSSAAGGNVRN